MKDLSETFALGFGFMALAFVLGALGALTIRKYRQFIGCLLGFHNWTCKAQEGIAPTYEMFEHDIAAEFREYAWPYCKHCGRKMRAP